METGIAASDVVGSEGPAYRPRPGISRAAIARAIAVRVAVKIVFQYEPSPRLAVRLQRLSTDGMEIVPCPEQDLDRFAALMASADAVFHVLRPITAEIIAAAPRLKLIQKIGVGVNTIDLEAARRRGVKVANMPGTNTRAVAELTLLLMLAALRRVPTCDAATRRGDGWRLEPALFDGLGELGGRTVGLVGYGAVARMLTPMLRALGARVLYTSRRRKAEAGAEWRSREALLAESDIVSLHLPLTPETEAMIDGAAIAAMKDGAVLVNTARGGLVDEAALVAALTGGKLRAAALDVFACEPVEPDNPLLALENTVLMPHVAWLTPETLERSLGIALDNCRRLRRGEEIRFRVA